MKDRLSIRINNDLMVSLDAISKRFNIKKSDLVRNLLERFSFQVMTQGRTIKDEQKER